VYRIRAGKTVFFLTEASYESTEGIMKMRHRKGNWFGALVLLAGILYLLADLAQTFTIGISGWTTFFLLSGIWLLSGNRNRRKPSGNTE
jgi:hypothetical protein